MAEIRTKDGAFLETDSLPNDADLLTREILAREFILGPMPAEEAEVDPGTFVPELQDYAREMFRLKKNIEPVVEFRTAGRIGSVSYWVFASEPAPDHPVHLFVVRNDYVTEFVCSDRAVTYREPETDTLHNRILTPEQAAVLEFCTTDYDPPPRP